MYKGVSFLLYIFVLGWCLENEVFMEIRKNLELERDVAYDHNGFNSK